MTTAVMLHQIRDAAPNYQHQKGQNSNQDLQGCLQFNCMAQFCSKTVALLMPGPMLAQEPHLKYVWCTHTICQYGENYAFITNPATTAPKEQCERTKIGHFAILLDRCAC